MPSTSKLSALTNLKVLKLVFESRFLHIGHRHPDDVSPRVWASTQFITFIKEARNLQTLSLVRGQSKRSLRPPTDILTVICQEMASTTDSNERILQNIQALELDSVRFTVDDLLTFVRLTSPTLKRLKIETGYEYHANTLLPGTWWRETVLEEVNGLKLQFEGDFFR